MTINSKDHHKDEALMLDTIIVEIQDRENILRVKGNKHFLHV